MKTVSKYLLTAVVVIALAMGLTACSSKKSDNGTATNTPANTTQGAQAASTGTQGTQLGSGSADTFNNLGSIGLSATIGAPPMKVAGAANIKDAGMSQASRLSAKLAKSKAINKATASIRKARAMGASEIISTVSDTCADGGTIEWEGSYDDVAGTFELNILAKNCKEGGTEIDGPMSLNASITETETSAEVSITQTLGDATNDLTLLEFSDSAYTVKVATLAASVTMSISGSVQNIEHEIFALTYGVNGTIDVTASGVGSFAITYTGFGFSLTSDVATLTIALIVNGGFSESWTDMSVEPNVANSVVVSFSNFKITDVPGNNFMDQSISGGFTIDFTPDECFEGAYTFVTNTPIRYNMSGDTSAGRITINDVVVVVFNANGTVTVTINGETAYNGSIDGLGELCDFQTLDE